MGQFIPKRRKWPWITGSILAGLVVLFVVVGILASNTGTRQALGYWRY